LCKIIKYESGHKRIEGLGRGELDYKKKEQLTLSGVVEVYLTHRTIALLLNLLSEGWQVNR
jgi:hypothetical protein